MLIQTTQNIDLIPSSLSARLYCDQHDKGLGVSAGRMFILNMRLNGANYIPQTGATVKIEGTKPNGATFSHALTYIANMVYLPIYEDMSDVAGDTKMQLVLTEGSNRTASQLIILTVQRSAYNP